jgi:HrpA-like RNA helicase
MVQHLVYLDSVAFCRSRAKREAKMLEQRLPIYRYKLRILDTVKRTAVTLLMAETGAGKSTQVVQYLHHHLFQVPFRENWRDSLYIFYFLKLFSE